MKTKLPRRKINGSHGPNHSICAWFIGKERVNRPRLIGHLQIDGENRMEVFEIEGKKYAAMFGPSKLDPLDAVLSEYPAFTFQHNTPTHPPQVG